MEIMAIQWERLIESLDSWTSASQVGPDHIEVALPGDDGRRVLIVMTPEEWVEMASASWDSFDGAIERVRQTLIGLGPGEGFAVYSHYGLVPSTSPTRPVAVVPAEMSAAEDLRNRVLRTFALSGFAVVLWLFILLLLQSDEWLYWAISAAGAASGIAVGFVQPWIVPSRRAGAMSAGTMLGALGLAFTASRLMPDEAIALPLGGFEAGLAMLCATSALRLRSQTTSEFASRSK